MLRQHKEGNLICQTNDHLTFYHFVVYNANLIYLIFFFMAEPEKSQDGDVDAKAGAEPVVGGAKQVAVGEPTALTTETSAAVAAATETTKSALEAMKEKLATKASPTVLAMLEPMPESKTGVGVRTNGGELYELAFVWDDNGRGPQKLYLKRMLRVEGPSLNGTFEEEDAFYINASNGSMLERGGSGNRFYIYATDSSFRERRGPHAMKAQLALANNAALAGRLSVGSKWESGIRIVYTRQDGGEFVFYGSDDSVGIYDRPDKRLGIQNSFDPGTVTPEELDSAINAAELAHNLHRRQDDRMPEARAE